MKPLWLFRCDALKETGLGHLNRCLGLAEALEERGQRICFTGLLDAQYQELLRDDNWDYRCLDEQAGSIADACATVAIAGETGAVGIVADNYRIAGVWGRVVSERSSPPILFDDFADRDEYSHFGGIINFTVGATDLKYSGVNQDLLLCGPRYFPVRRHLKQLRSDGAQVKHAAVRRMLVCLGGAAPLDVCENVLSVLSETCKGMEVRMLVGREYVPTLSATSHGIEVLPLSRSLVPHYKWADVCLAGGGLIKYECSYLGIPCAILSLNADQQNETNKFVSLGLGWDTGGIPRQDDWRQALTTFLNDDALRSRLSEAGLSCFPEDAPAILAEHLIKWSL